MSLGEAGLAPRFTEAVEKGEIEVRDATCPAVHTALQASEKGVPFMPLRGVLGSDLLKLRPDWKVSQNPFNGNADPIFVRPRDFARRRAVPRALGGRGGQRLDRPAPGARDNRACSEALLRHL